ncbi:SDR family NAD(P)-dependent oxidoreductase (plasmid) [Paraburkholderia sp. PREW-6R]|uniref:SDR family oxidoreductase n=1 Tax=Paraburkholderia sp. PREW-6R TaxID=3141544 RepID=UPI0031F48B89
MSDIPYGNALIIGAGFGISAALTRALRSAGLPVIIASRNPDRLAPLVSETGAVALQVDASDAGQVARLFKEAEARIGPPEIVIYNASSLVRGPIADLDPVQVEHAVSITALGAFHAIHVEQSNFVTKNEVNVSTPVFAYFHGPAPLQQSVEAFASWSFRSCRSRFRVIPRDLHRQGKSCLPCGYENVGRSQYDAPCASPSPCSCGRISNRVTLAALRTAIWSAHKTCIERVAHLPTAPKALSLKLSPDRRNGLCLTLGASRRVDRAICTAFNPEDRTMPTYLVRLK